MTAAIIRMTKGAVVGPMRHCLVPHKNNLGWELLKLQKLRAIDEVFALELAWS